MILDLNSQREFFKILKLSVFGAGVHAFNRLGLEEILEHYRLLALRYTLETPFIEKDLEVFSLEKGMGTKHIREPRNATTVIKMPQTEKYLSGFQQPAILVYKASSKMEELCKKNSWLLVAAPTKFGKTMFENKIIFRHILEKLGIAVPPGSVKDVQDLHYGRLMNSYGLPFVIQHPTRGGGKGTFFIHNKENFDLTCKKLKYRLDDDGREILDGTNKVIVSKFITGPSPSVAACVTRYGVLSCSPQLQVLDIPELYNPEKGSGLFCGHDWTSSRFTDSINQQVYAITEKIGGYFQQQGFKGIFGLDFILDPTQEKIYVVEANPRLLGQFPTLAMAQGLNSEPSLLGFHLLEYLNIEYELDLHRVNCLMRQPKTGAHLLMHNLTKKWARNYSVVKPGVYQLNKNNLVFLRPGYKLQHLRNEKEFIVTEGVPFKKSHFSPNRRLCRILTLARVLADDYQLTDWAREAVNKIYQSFQLRPVNFIKIKNFLFPHFLAKG